MRLQQYREQEALWVDAMQTEYLKTRTLTGVKQRWVIYVVGGHGNTGKHLLADEEAVLSDTLRTAEIVCLSCRLVFQLCATRLSGGKDRITVL